MSQRLVTPFINTNIPGAYPNIQVLSTPVGLGQSGVLIIMGEADGGPSYSQIALSANSFTVDQLAQVTQQYISGQIVDAFTALTAPSNDANITGSANLVYIVKTNTSAQATATIPGGYGSLTDSNYGVTGNSYKYQITNTQAEVAPTVAGGTIPAFGAALNGASFSIRLEGGAATVVTLSGTAGNHADVPTLVTELNSLLPSGITASAGTAPSSIQLTINTDAAANGKGWGKSFELVDSTSGDLASLGLTAGINVSSAEPAIEFALSNALTNLNSTIDISEDIALMIGYSGTTATLTINQANGTLTTTVTGGSGANLSIQLTQYKTISDLAAYINAQTGYSAAATAAAQQLQPAALDSVSAIGIATTVSGGQPGRVKDALYRFTQALATTPLVFAATAVQGFPATMTAPAFLAGGARGGTLANDIVNAIAQMGGVQANIIVPLFSQDASKDITAGNTASSSTYTIAAINALTKSHCIEYSTPSLKRNRIAICSMTDTYANIKSQAQSLASDRVSLAFQSPSQVNSAGVITVFQPWYAAVVAAGMQAGGFYKAIVNKLANVISFIDPTGFDSGSPGDVEDALNAGLLILTVTAAGNNWVSDQTTYGFDTNFVYNSIQAMYTSDLVALDLANSFQSAFVGQSLADVTASTALGFMSQKMDGYRKLKLIASSSDAPLGYKNAKVSINGPEMDVAVEIKLATAIYFIPISISISQVQSSAG